VPHGLRRVTGAEEPNPSRPRLAGLLRQPGLPLREVWALTSSELPWAVPDVIELEAERCSLDSLGAFTDER
jgi:hypothetical protein